ncbi:MAG: hypothetical protein Q4B52_05845, partial [Tissierellia bacterium]|nr:hypothetical protein [Tissierellia bacterium]
DVKQKTADELRREKNGLVNTRKNLKSLDNLLKIRLSNIERVHKRLITKIKKLKERVDQTIKLR